MKIGKLTNEELQNSILSKIRPLREEVVLRPEIGEDCGAIDFGGKLCVVSTDPVTAAQANMGRIAIHICCNDAASSGAEPIAMLLSLLIPPTCTKETIEEIMNQAQETAESLNVEIIGGHTEITDAVTRPVLTGTVLASCAADELVRSSGGQAGDEHVSRESFLPQRGMSPQQFGVPERNRFVADGGGQYQPGSGGDKRDGTGGIPTGGGTGASVGSGGGWFSVHGTGRGDGLLFGIDHLQMVNAALA